MVKSNSSSFAGKAAPNPIQLDIAVSEMVNFKEPSIDIIGFNKERKKEKKSSHTAARARTKYAAIQQLGLGLSMQPYSS